MLIITVKGHLIRSLNEVQPWGFDVPYECWSLQVRTVLMVPKWESRADLTYLHILSGWWSQSAACSGFSAGYEALWLYLQMTGHLAVNLKATRVCVNGDKVESTSLTDPAILFAGHLFIQQFVWTQLFVPRFFGFHVPPPANGDTKTRLRRPVIFAVASNTSPPWDGHDFSCLRR